MFNFKNVRFIKSAKDSKGLPHFSQVALLGRSNVGKSSLLNDIFQKRGMAKTSSMPGKTQLLNFFMVDEKLLFVDLPGYGYAKVSGKIKKEWSSYLESYLNKSPPQLALLLLDCRRKPSELDMQMGEWLMAQEVPTILVLTKVDKLSKNERMTNTREIIKEFDLPYVHYSTTKREGRQKLLNMVIDGITEQE
ncbi:MAG: putative GTP-binding protein EngB [Chlamydiales bacterium]|nr:putative GTP-binding protein EngB [Chlamydiales bacterium]MCH9636165.1 putative GTP-binding protein EngB [Chlamydiales bacterium]MCH9703813.1 ribosome biogenesis GTP-binding protein YihA/YsxC [Chlamydiota bacterium]